MSEAIRTRRLAILRVSPEWIVEMCRQRETPTRFWCTDNALPADVKFHGAGSDVEWSSKTATYDIIVESDTFDEVEIGKPLPVLPPPLIQTIDG